LKMEVKVDTIFFKSLPLLWMTEKDGSKSNTLREISDPKEREAYIAWKCRDGAIFVTIINTETGEGFTRKVSSIVDKTVYKPMKNQVLISWRHPE